jgi:hypothetical protein
MQKLASLHKRIGDLLEEDVDKLNDYIEIGASLPVFVGNHIVRSQNVMCKSMVYSSPDTGLARN